MKKPSHRSRRRLWLTALALTPLAGCGTGTFSSHPCGVLFTYGKAAQARAADELDDMKARGLYPEARQLIEDYGTTRDTIRACGA